MKPFNDKKNSSHQKHLINEQIRAKQIQVITETGENLGILSRGEALAKAEETNLDLVKIGEQDSIPIAKLMNYGKYLYIKKKQQNEAKKKQKVIQIKEIKMRPNIGEQDYQIKFNRAVQFLKDGKRVKFTLQFRGREMVMMKEIGPKFFQRIHNDLLEKKLGSLVEEQEQRGKPFWSKIYYIKGA